MSDADQPTDAQRQEVTQYLNLLSAVLGISSFSGEAALTTFARLDANALKTAVRLADTEADEATRLARYQALVDGTIAINPYTRAYLQSHPKRYRSVIDILEREFHELGGGATETLRTQTQAAIAVLNNAAWVAFADRLRALGANPAFVDAATATLSTARLEELCVQLENASDAAVWVNRFNATPSITEAWDLLKAANSPLFNDLAAVESLGQDLLRSMELGTNFAGALRGDLGLVRAWGVLSSFPTFRNQVDNLALLERVSDRFKYNGLEGFEALQGVFTSSASKQKLLDNISYALNNFPDHSSVKFSAIQTGEVKVISEAGTEVVRVIDQVPTLKKFEASGTPIGDPIDGFQLVENSGIIGYRVSDPTANVLGINFNSFLNSVADNFDASIAYTHEAFYYYQKQAWQNLEELFNTNTLNGGWPPARGGFNHEPVTFTVGEKFDRYQQTIYRHVIVDGVEVPEMGGTFTSPILGAPYSYPTRALQPAENANALYYEIEILTPLTFGGARADAIPWFGKPGLAKQVEFNIPVDPSTGRATTWTKLAEEGKVKITIHSSPNGTESAYEGIVIHVN